MGWIGFFKKYLVPKMRSNVGLYSKAKRLRDKQSTVRWAKIRLKVSKEVNDLATKHKFWFVKVTKSSKQQKICSKSAYLRVLWTIIAGQLILVNLGNWIILGSNFDWNGILIIFLLTFRSEFVIRIRIVVTKCIKMCLNSIDDFEIDQNLVKINWKRSKK